MPTLWTTAPEAYDYATATTEAHDVARIAGRPVRRVCIDEAGADAGRLDFLARYQAGRYGSGLHPTWHSLADLLDVADPPREPE